MKLTLTSIIAGLATIGLLAVSGTAYAAGSASFALSPANGSVTNGSTTTVAIYENGTNIYVVTATFTYDSSKLQLLGDSCAGAFSSTAASSGSSISCFTPGGTSPVSGSNEAAVLSFKAIATGSADVTVTGSQIASSSGNTWDGNSASTAITITTPPAPTPPTNPTSGSTSKGASNTSTGSKNSSSSTPASSSTSASGTTATTSSSTPATNGSTTSKPATGTTKSSVTPINASDTAAHTSATAAHLGLWGSFVAILLLIAAAYWFVFRKYTYTFNISAVAKSSATAPAKGKKSTAKD
jgi:hypothetical protein